MSVKLLTEQHLELLSLKGGYTGLSESTLVNLPHCWKSHGPRCGKTCLRGFANNTGADQPAHLHSLISAFVICFVESIIFKLATVEIAIFWLVPVAKETGLKLIFATRPTCRGSYAEQFFIFSECTQVLWER